MMDLTGIGSILDLGGKILDRVIPDPAQRDAAKLEMLKAQQAGEWRAADQVFELAKGQIGVNAVEAASSSLFVSGPRPFIMWVCGIALLYVSLLEPIGRFAAVVMYGYKGAFPIIDTTITLQLLFGLLGLGAMRSYDKKNGTAS